MRKELFKGMLFAIGIYALTLFLIYFNSVKDVGITAYFSNRTALKTLVPMITVATIPNILLFMYFIRKNWVYKARGIISVILLVIVVMAYIKFIA